MNCENCGEEIVNNPESRKRRKDKRFCTQKCHDANKYKKASKQKKEFEDEFGLNIYTFKGLAKKFQLIELLGGKCEKCGYNKNVAGLDFHHIDRYDKVFEVKIQKLNYKSNDEIIKEASKCMLLCSNCHRELHAPFMDMEHVRRTLALKSEIKNNLIT